MKLMSRGALDPRWTTHHTSVAASFMLATIKVIRKNPGAQLQYDPDTQTYNGAFTTVFEGNARVQPYGITGDMVVGQDTTGRRLMRVQIEELETGIRLDDMVIVQDSPDFPELTAYTLEVRGAITSSNFQRVRR